MTTEQCIRILEQYRQMLVDQGSVQEMDFSTMRHVHFMCSEAINIFRAGQVEKGMRWLGFIQGALWSNGVRTIEEMKEDNRNKET